MEMPRTTYVPLIVFLIVSNLSTSSTKNLTVISPLPMNVVSSASFLKIAQSINLSFDENFSSSIIKGETERVSVSNDGTEGNLRSGGPIISADGRYVAFSSSAYNLVVGDNNVVTDVFVHDRQTSLTLRVSVDSLGVEGNGTSWSPDISADGRYVAFGSYASNLVSGDNNGFEDVFVHDNQTGITERVSISGDGTEGNNESLYPSISEDGRYVAFSSSASNLVVGDNNIKSDVFVHDRTTGQTERVSVSNDGTEGNLSSGGANISADGRCVAFSSSASNLVVGDNNITGDVFVHDRLTNLTVRVSVDSLGVEGNRSSGGPSISGENRYVAFESYAYNLVSNDNNVYQDVFVHDLQTGQTIRVSEASDGTEGDGYSSHPFISDTGRYVVFLSVASNLVDQDSNMFNDNFIRDRLTGTTTLITKPITGAVGNGPSFDASISDDGRYIAFNSAASNLVVNDNNSVWDVFVRDRGWDSSLTITGDTPDPSTIGQEVTLDFTVSGPLGSGFPTGIVTITVEGSSETCNNTLINGTGSCVLEFENAGTYSLVANYDGDSEFNGSSDLETHIVEKWDSTTIIISDTPDPSWKGQSITVSFNVVGPPGSSTPTGNVIVTVEGGTETCSDLLIGGSGSCVLTFSTTGTYSLVATYGGDVNFNTSIDEEQHFVQQKWYSVTSIVTDSPDPSTIGQEVTLDFTVSGPLGSGFPTGIVTITVEGSSETCNDTLINGTGSCVLEFENAGTYSLVANYDGDSEFNGSSDLETHIVEKWDSTTFIISDTPDPSWKGQSITVSFNVVGPPGSSTPTGNVTVTVEGSVEMCSDALTLGPGSCMLTFTYPGIYTLIATYEGDSNFNSSSDTEPHVVLINLYLPLINK